MMKKYVSNQSGFNLIEIMVAVGLLGLISYAVMTLTNQQVKQTKTAEFKSEVSETFYEISTMIKKSKACEASLQGLKPGDQVPLLRMSNTTDDDGIIAKIGEEYRNTGIIVENMKLLEPETTGQNVVSFDPSTGEGAFLLEITLKRDENKSPITGKTLHTRKYAVNAIYKQRKVGFFPTLTLSDDFLEQTAQKTCAQLFGVPETSPTVGYETDSDSNLKYTTGDLGAGITLVQFECIYVDPVWANNDLDSCSM